jgi:transcriptional regulator with XRE-family HTH domain
MRMIFVLADKKGFSSGDLAARTGYAQGTVSALRNGRWNGTKPTRESLPQAVDLAEAIGWELILIPKRRGHKGPPILNLKGVE